MLIAIFMPPNGHALEVSGPSDVFAEANRQLGRRVYDLRFISDRSDLLTCFSGLRLVPDRTITIPMSRSTLCSLPALANPCDPPARRDRVAEAPLPGGAKIRFGMHRRIPPRGGGPAGRKARHNALGVRSGAIEGPPHRRGRARSDLRTGRRDGHLGRRQRGDRSSARPRRGRPWPSSRAFDRAMACGFPEAAGRTVAIQRAPCLSGRGRIADRARARMGSEQLAGRSFSRHLGAASAHEQTKLCARVSARNRYDAYRICRSRPRGNGAAYSKRQIFLYSGSHCARALPTLRRCVELLSGVWGYGRLNIDLVFAATTDDKEPFQNYCVQSHDGRC